MIFPQLSPQYYNENRRDIIERMEAFYAESITLNQSFWVEADIDTRFWSGETSLFQELYPNLPANRRRMFNFNRLRRICNMISGHQRRTRKSMIAVPVEGSDQVTSDQFSKILSHASSTQGILETISDAFEGSLITGMNLLHVWLDFRDDPLSGTLRVDKCDYNSFLVDPYFRKHDLSDCNGLWKRSYLTKKEVISLMPQYADEIAGLSTQEMSRDAKFQYMPESYGFSYKNLLMYDEFFYRDYRSTQILTDVQTGETLEWRFGDEAKLREYLHTYPTVRVEKVQVPTVRQAIVVQGKVLYDGPNNLGIDQYPFVPVLTYYNPQIPYYYLRVQGIVRDLRDSQYLYSRRKVIELDILESQINSGWIYKENSLINPKDIFLSGQGRGLALKQEAQMTDVQPIVPPQIPPSMFQLSESLSREIMEVSGVNEELLGSANDDKAGVLAMLRQGAGLTTLQPLFDRLDFAQKLLGKIIIKAVQNNYTPGKIKRILNEEPSPEFYNRNFGNYDCVVEDGLNTATQKQMQFAQLLQMRELGIGIPDDLLIDSAPLQNKTELIEAVKQSQEQASQQAQLQMQSALAEQEARTQLAQARAVADQGLGLERVSRIQENQALAIERKAEAEKDHFAAVLDFVKAIKELEGIDIGNLERLIALARIVSQEETRATSPQSENVSNMVTTLQGLQRNLGTQSVPSEVTTPASPEPASVM